MSETHDLTQRAEMLASCYPQAKSLLDALLAALVQAEQREDDWVRIAAQNAKDANVRLEAAEAKLVQAEQEKAALLQKLEIGEQIEVDLGERLATQEAAIRQVEQEMRQYFVLVYGDAYREQISEWADTLRAILPAEQTVNKGA